MSLDIKIEKRTLNFSEDKKEVFVAKVDRNFSRKVAAISINTVSDDSGTSASGSTDSGNSGSDQG